MKILAIDYGIRRIGLAVSDEEGSMAFPVKTIHRGTRDQVFSEIIEVVGQRGVTAIALGHPLGLNGERTLSTRQVENFRASLERRLDIPVYLIEESHTTEEAEAKLRDAGVPPGKRRDIVDQQAAVEILLRYLYNWAPE